jgi:hypothetical protein
LTTADKAPITLDFVPARSPVKLFGLSGRERIMKMIKDRRGDGVVIGADDPQAATTGDWLIMDEDCLYDGPVIDWLLAGSDRAVDADGARAGRVSSKGQHQDAVRAWIKGAGRLPEGIDLASPDSIGAAYRTALRKRETPYCLRISAIGREKAEQRLFAGSYKGVTDFVTKYVWPWPAFHLTRLCAALKISPNMVTSLSLVLVLAAFWFFWQGDFASGLLAAWGMTFLDTVDGKLARTTLTSSKWGNIFDHGIDLVHPPFWYWAWAHGLSSGFGRDLTSGPEPSWLGFSSLDWALWVILVGYVVGRLFEGYFIARFKLELHIWRRFDSFFRLIVSRRNPNLILLSLGLLLGAPASGFLWVALWTIASLAVHGVQIVQAERAARNHPLSSWLDGALRQDS